MARTRSTAAGASPKWLRAKPIMRSDGQYRLGRSAATRCTSVTGCAGTVPVRDADAS